MADYDRERHAQISIPKPFKESLDEIRDAIEIVRDKQGITSIPDGNGGMIRLKPTYHCAIQVMLLGAKHFGRAFMSGNSESYESLVSFTAKALDGGVSNNNQLMVAQPLV